MTIVGLFKDSDYEDQIAIHLGDKKLMFNFDNGEWVIKKADDTIIARTEHEDIAVKILTSEDII